MRFCRRSLLWLPIIPFLFGASALGGGEFQLATRFESPDHGFNRELKTWSASDLSALNSRNSRERDPETGKVARWSGVLLSDVLDRSLKDLPPKSRAEVDLLILKNAAGGQALIPRAFVVKYPILLATRRDGRALEARAPMSIMPWTSKTKILNEGAPLQAFFLPSVNQIVFANSREHFARFRLKRRTDPAAIRGEKLFVQNCASCHDSGRGPAVEKLMSLEGAGVLATSEHPKSLNVPSLDTRQKGALTSFLDAYRIENAPAQPDAKKPLSRAKSWLGSED